MMYVFMMFRSIASMVFEFIVILAAVVLVLDIYMYVCLQG